MASNHTPEYGLNQWILDDSVIMEEFNTDNRNIEQALLELKAALPKFQTGSFTITEQHMKENQYSIIFDFPPRMVILVQGNKQTDNLAPTILLHGVTECICALDNGSNTDNKPELLHITWDGNRVGFSTNSYILPRATYHFLAIG